jgi:hypothetical protein
MAVRMVMAIQRKYLRQADKGGVFILVVIRLYEVQKLNCAAAVLMKMDLSFSRFHSCPVI